MAAYRPETGEYVIAESQPDAEAGILVCKLCETHVREANAVAHGNGHICEDCLRWQHIVNRVPLRYRR